MQPKIILFYKFVSIEEPEALRDEQRALAKSLDLKGRMLLAREGINATFEGASKDIEAYIQKLRENPAFADIVFKESEGNGCAFNNLDIRVRDEVVTLGAGVFDIRKETAPEITAEELEKMYESEEDFVVLDLRNEYEIEVGQFEKTVHPGLKNFRELPERLSRIGHLKQKKVIAVCTGGIRCEKATCLLKKEGFENIFQLKDGIHTYMQEYPGQHFKGSLFVFDNRMVTPVADSVEREVVGKCAFCGDATEEFYSDDRVRPSEKVLCCESCAPAHSELRMAGV